VHPCVCLPVCAQLGIDAGHAMRKDPTIWTRSLARLRSNADSAVAALGLPLEAFVRMARNFPTLLRLDLRSATYGDKLRFLRAELDM
jgi:hypothetical protein